METDFSFGGDNDLSYEESNLPYPSPFSLTPPGHSGSYDMEQRRQEEERDSSSQSITLYPDPDAALNLNTNANSRGDCQAYVELNEFLKDQNQEGYWQETGRWVGYEESYDMGERNWGPSHISYLTFKSMIQLRKTISTAAVLLDLGESSLSGVAEKVVDELVSKREIRQNDREGLLRALLQRRSQSEQKDITEQSSGIEMQTFSVTRKRDAADSVEASVVLSGALDFLQKPAVAFIRLSEAVVLDSALEAPVPVRFIFVLVGPGQSSMDYHEMGRSMAALVADRVFNAAAFLAQDNKELTDAIADFMDCSIVVPPTEIHDEVMLHSIIGFQKKLLRDRLRPSDTRLFFDEKPIEPPKNPERTPWHAQDGLFGGMVKDIKRRYRVYLSDYIDAVNPQVLAAVIFIYFAALSPAITFGGLLADKTEHMMGVSELMISTCIQGIIFCLIAAQPVLVIGFSGPLLVFEEAFYGFCKSQEIEYIVGRVWVGVWLVVIVVVVVAVDGSFLVKFISRFTQEIFSILISLIFIYETFAKLMRIFQAHPLILNYGRLNDTINPFNPVTEMYNLKDEFGNITVQKRSRQGPYPNTALLSMCLMIGCFFIAFFFRQFKNGHFLPGMVRRMIGDFGVPIAIFIMVYLDIIIDDTYTQKLVVPKGLMVSNPSARGWLINPLGEKKEFPIWMMFACIVPAMLVFILIFLESQITTLIVSKPERKMVKGSGFHFDLLILVTMGGIGAIFGVPWLSAATVRSVSHANALTIMSKGPKPEIEKVLEQRVSGVLVAALVGISILMEPVLKMIPMTALFGIFLYMGVTSLSGIQLWDRILLLLTPKKYYPKDAYATMVKPLRMHLFTLIQIMCLVILWVVKSSPASLALPFLLILTIPLRMFMTGRLFSTQEMKCLDADDVKVSLEEEPGEDVYTESRLP